MIFQRSQCSWDINLYIYTYKHIKYIHASILYINFVTSVQGYTSTIINYQLSWSLVFSHLDAYLTFSESWRIKHDKTITLFISPSEETMVTSVRFETRRIFWWAILSRAQRGWGIGCANDFSSELVEEKIPSWKLTYPTWRKGNSSSKLPP